MGIVLGIIGGGWGLLKRIPAWLWIALAVALLLFGVVSQMKNQIAEAYATGKMDGSNEATELFTASQADADALARKKAAATDTASTTISKGSANAFDKTSDDITDRSDAIRVRHDAAIKAYSDRNQGSTLDTSGVPFASGKPVEAPPQDCVPFAVALPAFTDAERNTAQLTAVLDWWDAQVALHEKVGIEAGK